MAISEKASNSETALPNILVQIHFDDPQEVAKKETGIKLAKEIYKQQWSNNTDRNFFAGRAAHQLELEKWSLGKQDMMQFLSFMGVNDANKSEANIDMTPIMVGAQFCGTLTTSLSRNQEYPCVKAVDADSLDEKIDREMEALFRMREAATIDKVQQAMGAQLEPTDAYVPNTELAAKVYFEQKDQLPKEVKFQKILNKALLDNQYERVLKPFMIRNNIVFNTEVTKVGRAKENGQYKIEAILPKNTFYNYFLSDNGRLEISYIGRAYNLKVRDIRNDWGKKNENDKQGLSEEEIFKFAKLSAQNFPVSPVGFSYGWQQQYSNYQGSVPWDDNSGFVIDFEIKISESQYWVSKTDSYGKKNITEKKGIPKPTSESSKLIKKDKDVVYRCVYAPYADMIIYWGKGELKDNFTYSINIPYNNGEYVPSLFERALEPLKRLSLVVMKEKLLIARLSPTGYRIDVESAKNIMTGNGRTYEWEDIVRIKTITGIELYSSKGLNPLENAPAPISTASHDSTLQNIIQLDQTRIGIINEIRDLLGVPIYLDGSNVGQRTAGRLAEGQREATSNVTGFIQNSHNQIMEETLGKICLMAWQDVVTDKQESQQDLINTKFDVFVRMKITDDEKAILERDIERWSTPSPNGQPPLLSPADAYAIRQIDDYKLAEMYLIDKIEENRSKSIQDSERLQAQNQKVQQASAQMAADQQKQLQAEKIAAEKDMLDYQTTKQKELKLLEGVLAAAAKDETGQLIKMFMPAIQQLVPNVTLPLQIENQQTQNNIQEGMQAAAQQQGSPDEQQQLAPQEESMQQEQQPQMM